MQQWLRGFLCSYSSHLYRDIDSAVDEISNIVRAIKKANFNVDLIEKLSPQERVELMKTKKGLVTDLESLINELNDIVRMSKSKMNSDQQVGSTTYVNIYDLQALWLNEISSMKYGTKALRRAETVDTKEIIDELNKITLEGLSRHDSDVASMFSLKSPLDHLMVPTQVARS